MAINTDLIRSGLPWSSPLKIIVQAAQVINDATINRGLLNLLNNDYYLDIKTEAINNYIENAIAPHIADKTIHFTLDSVLEKVGIGYFLEYDAVVSIPVVNILDDNTQQGIQIEKINQLIDMVPKYLNGHILIIQFVYASVKNIKQNSQIIYLPSAHVNTNVLPVCFNGFSNGTIIIRSNILPSAAIIANDINLITDLNQFITYKDFNTSLNTALADLLSTNQISQKIIDAFTFER